VTDAPVPPADDAGEPDRFAGGAPGSGADVQEPPAHTCPSMSVRLRFNPPGRPSFHWCRKQYTVSG